VRPLRLNLASATRVFVCAHAAGTGVIVSTIGGQDRTPALSSLEAQHTFEVFECEPAVLFLVVYHVVHLRAHSKHEQIKDDHYDIGDGDGYEYCYLHIRPIFANLRQRAPEGKPS
jgi:hypothetical protein